MKRMILALCLILIATSSFAQNGYQVFQFRYDPGVIVRPDGAPTSFDIRVFGLTGLPATGLDLTLTLNDPLPISMVTCGAFNRDFSGVETSDGVYTFDVSVPAGMGLDLSGDTPMLSTTLSWGTGPFDSKDKLIKYASNDLNGDLVVNLSDITIFTQMQSFGFNPLIDFDFSGVINHRDQTIFMYGYYSQCGPSKAAGQNGYDFQTELEKAGAVEPTTWDGLKAQYR